jgi:hypothetical protein
MANTIDELKSYREVVDHFKQARRKINLLLGNGFRIAYDRGIFFYNALIHEQGPYIQPDEVYSKIVSLLNSVNRSRITTAEWNFNCNFAKTLRWVTIQSACVSALKK